MAGCKAIGSSLKELGLHTGVIQTSLIGSKNHRQTNSIIVPAMVGLLLWVLALVQEICCAMAGIRSIGANEELTSEESTVQLGRPF